VVHGRAGGLESEEDVRAAVLDGLERTDRLTVLGPLPRVGDRLVEAPLRAPQLLCRQADGEQVEQPAQERRILQPDCVRIAERDRRGVPELDARHPPRRVEGRQRGGDDRQLPAVDGEEPRSRRGTPGHDDQGGCSSDVAVIPSAIEPPSMEGRPRRTCADVMEY